MRNITVIYYDLKGKAAGYFNTRIEERAFRAMEEYFDSVTTLDQDLIMEINPDLHEVIIKAGMEILLNKLFNPKAKDADYAWQVKAMNDDIENNRYSHTLTLQQFSAAHPDIEETALKEAYESACIEAYCNWVRGYEGADEYIFKAQHMGFADDVISEDEYLPIKYSIEL